MPLEIYVGDCSTDAQLLVLVQMTDAAPFLTCCISENAAFHKMLQTGAFCRGGVETKALHGVLQVCNRFGGKSPNG
jgi:hypothetical protein